MCNDITEIDGFKEAYYYNHKHVEKDINKINFLLNNLNEITNGFYKFK